MRICVILEGCYPYIRGGVSTWMHQYINNMPEHEFVLWVIGAKAEDKDKFTYELPKNVVGVQQVFLDDALRVKDSGVFQHRFNEAEKEALRRLVASDKPNWELLFEMYQVRKINPMAYLKSQSFLDTLIETCREEFPYIAFSDAFHSVRSRLLPVLYLMGTPIPEADCYHAISTGYGGLLATMGAYIHHKPLLLTEHGIYTREREEEIIRSDWVARAFKPHWIDFFYMLSDMIYARAFRVSALFTRAMHTQIDMGCPAEKCRVIENGISYENLAGIPLKPAASYVDIGVVVREADEENMAAIVGAFGALAARIGHVRLHVIGGKMPKIKEDPTLDEDARKAREALLAAENGKAKQIEDNLKKCQSLLNEQGLREKAIFPGIEVDIAEYAKLLDFILLPGVPQEQLRPLLKIITVPGTDPEYLLPKCRVTESEYAWLEELPPKDGVDIVEIGAPVRMAPIKDIKTMIYAFFELSCRMDNVRLHIMGGVDDEQYNRECRELVKQLGLQEKIVFPSFVAITEYFRMLDYTILTSISEGQPLSVLESFAARRPCVTTDVGCCNELLNGKPGDTLGKAGLFVPPMQREKLADAMEILCSSRQLREEMGEIGQRRAEMYFRYIIMITKYKELYKEVEDQWQA